MDIIEKIESLAVRLERAKELVRRGEIRQLSENEWLVGSGEHAHLVHGSICDCQDFRIHENDLHGLCKHRLAVILVVTGRMIPGEEKEAKPNYIQLPLLADRSSSS